jgi:hypothetical protein
MHVPAVLQEASLPRFDPEQVQLQGPEQSTLEGMPTLQRPLTGVVLAGASFAGPHLPLTGGASEAEQIAVVPPLEPAHLHDHGPMPATLDATPEEQRLDVGTLVTLVPLVAPQAPFMGTAIADAANPNRSAEQAVVAPPYAPLHVQIHGPEPVRLEAVPLAQRLAVAGAAARAVPASGPHAPLTGTRPYILYRKSRHEDWVKGLGTDWADATVA